MPADSLVPIASSGEEVVAGPRVVVANVVVVVANTKGAELTVAANTTQIVMFAEDMVAAEAAERSQWQWCAVTASSAAIASPAVMVWYALPLLVASAEAAA